MRRACLVALIIYTKKKAAVGRRGFMRLYFQVFPLPAKSSVARGSEPSARHAERSQKRKCGGGGQYLPSSPFPALASRMQDKPSAAESGDVGAVALTCDLRILTVDYTAAAALESASVRRLAER